jgi:hypothetical protein
MLYCTVNSADQTITTSLLLLLSASSHLHFHCSYDDEWDTYENDVTATTRGRGTAQAGQINIAIAPNDDSSVSGTVRATANQGSAVGGAFTLTNSGVEAYHGINVSAHTVQYGCLAWQRGVLHHVGFCLLTLG